MAEAGTGGSKLDICLIAHAAYGAIAGESSGHIGGVERQAALMARWLAGRGHRVSLLTWDEGQPAEADAAGVRLIRLCRREEGLPGLRFFHPRWTSLNRGLARADADVYYQNGAEYVTGQVALWCRRRTRGFVYSAAADADCERQLPLLATVRERVLYRFGVRHADRVIVQTRRQQQLLRTGFARNSIVVPMPCPEPAAVGSAMSKSTRPSRILWIGRISQEKRPDRLLDVAEAMPDLTFDLVGPHDDSAYARGVIERARRLRNVAVHGRAPRGEVPEFYRRAACLCATSDREGFPNTFLEAWSHGVPVISTFDPDQLIAERGLGVAVSDPGALAEAIRVLLRSPDRWATASSNARRYYMEHHTVEQVMPRFEQVFAEVKAMRQPGEARRREAMPPLTTVVSR
jgi:glycosyltransferase involved in cell wall biosynthesis